MRARHTKRRRPRRATPADCIAWAREGGPLALWYARLAGEMHRAQGVTADWAPFDRPGEERLAAAWQRGLQTPRSGRTSSWPPPATTHAARTAAAIEEDEP